MKIKIVIIIIISMLMIFTTIPVMGMTIDPIEIGTEPKESTVLTKNVTLSFFVQRYNETGVLVPASNCDIWMWIYYSSQLEIPQLIGFTDEDGLYLHENYSGYRVFVGNDVRFNVVHGWHGGWAS